MSLVGCGKGEEEDDEKKEKGKKEKRKKEKREEMKEKKNEKEEKKKKRRKRRRGKKEKKGKKREKKEKKERKRKRRKTHPSINYHLDLSPQLTISTTNTCAGILRLYKNFSMSFCICMLLSSISVWERWKVVEW